MGSGRTGLRARRVTPPAPTADETTEAASGWAWRWISWASWPVTPVILAVAVTAVVLDVVTAWWGHPRWTVGGLVMSPALRSASCSRRSSARLGSGCAGGRCRRGGSS